MYVFALPFTKISFLRLSVAHNVYRALQAKLVTLAFVIAVFSVVNRNMGFANLATVRDIDVVWGWFWFLLRPFLMCCNEFICLSYLFFVMQKWSPQRTLIKIIGGFPWATAGVLRYSLSSFFI